MSLVNNVYLEIIMNIIRAFYKGHFIIGSHSDSDRLRACSSQDNGLRSDLVDVGDLECALTLTFKRNTW